MNPRDALILPTVALAFLCRLWLRSPHQILDEINLWPAVASFSRHARLLPAVGWPTCIGVGRLEKLFLGYLGYFLCKTLSGADRLRLEQAAPHDLAIYIIFKEYRPRGAVDKLDMSCGIAAAS